jgi:hypothetical protein
MARNANTTMETKPNPVCLVPQRAPPARRVALGWQYQPQLTFENTAHVMGLWTEVALEVGGRAVAVTLRPGCVFCDLYPKKNASGVPGP